MGLECRSSEEEESGTGSSNEQTEVAAAEETSLGAGSAMRAWAAMQQQPARPCLPPAAWLVWLVCRKRRSALKRGRCGVVRLM